jgi:uncharacterized protein (TIGR02996 family)
MSEDGFLRAIVVDPGNDTSRLVYADWLEEQGEPVSLAKAEFLRVTVELTSPVNSKRRKAGRQRLGELAAGLDSRWLSAVSRFPLETCAAADSWARLHQVGWLDWVPEENRMDLWERFARVRAEDPDFAFLALGALGFDGECIMGESGPDEPLSYYAKLQQFAAASKGRFQPVKIMDRVDWQLRYTTVSFAHNGLEYRWDEHTASDWFSDKVLDLVNRALKESGVKERFIALPAVDQCWSLVFVPPSVYARAVKAGLIPTQEAIDALLEARAML